MGALSSKVGLVFFPAGVRWWASVVFHPKGVLDKAPASRHQMWYLDLNIENTDDGQVTDMLHELHWWELWELKNNESAISLLHILTASYVLFSFRPYYDLLMRYFKDSKELKFIDVKRRSIYTKNKGDDTLAKNQIVPQCKLTPNQPLTSKTVSENYYYN